MAEDRPVGNTLDVGPGGGGGWIHVHTPEPVPLARALHDRQGAWLSREPVGFPGRVVLEAPAETPAGLRLRVMKALALAVAEVTGAGPGVDWLRIRVGEDPPGASGVLAASVTALDGALVIDIGPAWLDPAHGLVAGRAAARDAVAAGRDAIERATAADPTPTPERDGPPPEVLLFKNVFTKDVDRGDAHHVNPGVHYLISALHAAGIETVLLDGKHPLQDVCECPPQVGQVLRPEQFLTDPAELERALDRHPDLTLVVLTVLERSFAQVRDLCRFVRERSRAWIAVGGVLPTLTPEHAFVHLPDADVLVRGDGEQALPALARALAGRPLDDGLDDTTVAQLGRLDGLLARAGTRTLASRIDRVQCVADLDRLDLDFSFLQRHNVEAGLSLSTSRGCVYACRFCSVLDKRRWRAPSAGWVLRQLDRYERRLIEIYGAPDRVARDARLLQLWDDDFFIDRGRAAAILAGMADRGFTTSFVQGTVASFFERDGRKVSRRVDEALLDAIPRSLFTDLRGLKLGTENFNDRELKRLGKPYDYTRIRALAEALARRGLPQDHYWIICNRQTSLDDLLDNLCKIAELRWLAGEGFKILQPSWLMNLFPTALYRSCQVRGTDREQPTLGTLAEPGCPEWDYPFVIPERPARQEVFEVLRRFPRGMHFGVADPPRDLYDGPYEEGDPEYTRVFGALEHTLRQLSDRLAAVDGAGAAATRLRIDDALARHLGAMRRVPDGLLRRLAPGLPDGSDPAAAATRLLVYLDELLAEAGRRGTLPGPVESLVEDGRIILSAGGDGARVELGVEPAAGDPPCAFRTRNLAFVVRGGMDTAEQRDGGRRVIEAFQAAIQRLDTAPLD